MKDLLEFRGSVSWSYETWMEYACFSRDETSLACCCAKTVLVCAIDSDLNCKLNSILNHNDYVWKCCFGDESSHIWTASSDGYLYCWDLKLNTVIISIRAHDSSIYSCSVHPNAPVIATAGADGTIKCFSSRSGKCLNVFPNHDREVDHVTFSPKGIHLASCSKDKTICILSYPLNSDKTVVRKLFGHEHWIYYCSFSPAGDMLASVSADKMIGLWSVAHGDLLCVCHGHTNIIWGCSFIVVPDDKVLLASCSSDKTIRLWDTKTGLELECHRHLGGVSDGTAQLLSCAVAPVSGILAVTSFHGVAYLATINRPTQ